MNKEDKQRWEKLEPLPVEMEEFILEMGKKTGSRIYGGATENSDLDILILSRPPITFTELISNGYAAYPSHNYRDAELESVYTKFTTRSYPINLLLFKYKEIFDVYSKATDIMRGWRKDLILRRYMKDDKSRRIELFEFVKEIITELEY